MDLVARHGAGPDAGAARRHPRPCLSAYFAPPAAPRRSRIRADTPDTASVGALSSQQGNSGSRQPWMMCWETPGPGRQLSPLPPPARPRVSHTSPPEGPAALSGWPSNRNSAGDHSSSFIWNEAADIPKAAHRCTPSSSRLVTHRIMTTR